MNKLFKFIIRLLVVLGVVMAIYNHIQWKNNIYNPNNREYVNEVLFNSDTTLTDKEIQEAFNKRYLNN